MSSIRRGVLAASITVPLALAATTSMVAHDEQCLESLKTMPVETIELPEGMHWERLSVNLVGSINGTVAEDARPRDQVSFSVICVGDALSWMEANQRFDSVVEPESESRSVAVAPLGDYVEANRIEIGETSNIYIQWGKGPVLVDMSVDELVDWNLAEDFALALDALLPLAE